MSNLEYHLRNCQMCYDKINQLNPKVLYYTSKLRIEDVSLLISGGGDRKMYSNRLPIVHFVRIEIPL